MEKEKTAVEYFADELSFLNNEYDMNRMTPKMYIDRLHMVKDKAKQMEKEQMNKMYGHAVLAILDGNGHGQTFDEYYESKYGKDENKAENNN